MSSCRSLAAWIKGKTVSVFPYALVVLGLPLKKMGRPLVAAETGGHISHSYLSIDYMYQELTGAYVRQHPCVCVCLWTLGLISQVPPSSWMLRVSFVLELGWLGWQARKLPVYLSSTRIITTCTWLFLCVVGIELRPSVLCIKQLADRAVSQHAPSVPFLWNVLEIVWNM